MNDDPMKCAELHVATRAHLAERGYTANGDFNVTMVRYDGETFASACDLASMVRELIDMLGPPKVFLMVGEAEDHGAMLAAITPPTLH
jgi:hypothetical protein